MARKSTKRTEVKQAPAEPASSRRGPLDAVTIEIVRQGIVAITGDMKMCLMRTACSAAIYETSNFAVGLFTPAAEALSIGAGVPMLMSSMAEAVKTAIRRFGVDGMKPGDIYITNDAAVTGACLNDVALILPLFHRSALAGFVCCIAHWSDIGGQGAGMTADLFTEGLQIPVLKYRDRGAVNEDLVDIIKRNVRNPERSIGDLQAQVMAATAGERRFLELLDRFGLDRLAEAFAAIMDRSEAIARARTRTIPDGIYEAESFMDDDGVTLSREIPVRVRVVIENDEMTIDLTGLSRQVRGFFNAGAAVAQACARIAHKCLISPADDPVNDGAFRNLKTIVPPGRVVSAVRPAPVRSWMTIPMTVVDTIFKALAPALPGRVSAGNYADLVAAQFSGFNPKTAEFFVGHSGALGGGQGAKQAEDGVSAGGLYCGNARNPSSEQLEVRFPLVVERYALIPDSGGAGRRRGGLGVERVVRARTEFTLSTQIERSHCRPWGHAGGRDGRANAVALRVNGQWKTEFPNAKVTALIRTGDAFRLRSGGGGGFGPPLERPVEDVLHDVRQGYVSAHEAAVFYGVVIDPGTFKVNEPATILIRGASMPALPPPEGREP